MSKLDVIRKYTEVLSKAAKWKNSEKAILHIADTKNDSNLKERIFEFYCALRVLKDLSTNYNIEITNNTVKNVFPKAPANKTGYPYFVAKNKTTGSIVFQICIGTNIVGKAGETSAPDISFQKQNASLSPKCEDVIMIADAKFKHDLNNRVTDGEFSKVFMMITNLDCQEGETNGSYILFDELAAFKGNCLVSNGREYKDNVAHHQLCKVKEIVNFGEGLRYRVIG